MPLKLVILWNLGNKATGQIAVRDICFQGFLGGFHLHWRRGRSTFLYQVVNKAFRAEPINSLGNHHLHKLVSFCQKTASKEGLKKRNPYVRLEHSYQESSASSATAQFKTGVAVSSAMWEDVVGLVALEFSFFSALSHLICLQSQRHLKFS